MMTLIRAFLSITRPASQRLSTCELNGMLIGVLAGVLFALVWLGGGNTTSLSYPLWLYIALVLAIFSWLLLLIMLCWFLRYEAGPLIIPLFFNALITCIFTIYLCNLIAEPLVFFLVGLFIGFWIGRLLCRLCQSDAFYLTKRS